jgi:NADH dehydrogenase
MRALVLGGAGFIGRHVCAALLARGHAVFVGTRRPRRRHPCDRAVRFERCSSPADWAPVLGGVDVVVNAVGILRERPGESYDAIHRKAPDALARACAAAGIRLLHVSALGLSERARSAFLRSKAAGERAVAASGADYSIVRPSLLDGPGGYGAKWLRLVARWPAHPVPADAAGRLAAMRVEDLGEAIARLCEAPTLFSYRKVELGGTRAYTMGEYLAALRPAASRRALLLKIPPWLARLASHAFDLLHFSPYSFGHHELMRSDNVPRPNLLPALLGRAPSPVGERSDVVVGLPEPARA